MQFLKGTYDLKVKAKPEIMDEVESKNLDSEYKEKALNSVGGSMVFVERKRMVHGLKSKDEDSK